MSYGNQLAYEPLEELIYFINENNLNEKRSLFKLFMGDTGLLCASCMDNIQFDILQGNVDVNLGSILENIMAQQIKSNGFALHFFDTKKYGELDFVIQNGTKIDLVEKNQEMTTIVTLRWSVLWQ